MPRLFLIVAAIMSMTTPVFAENRIPFEANIRLPNGSTQRVTVTADSISNTKSMLESQYCPEKKDCVVSGPHFPYPR